MSSRGRPLERTRSIEDLHELRLMALLHDLVRKHQRKGAGGDAGRRSPDGEGVSGARSALQVDADRIGSAAAVQGEGGDARVPRSR